ncbi:MAG: glycosyl transferase [Saprospiraceae bacterium]|nr:glycosyl transferase [Saprospiraceae bacterium]
MKVLYAVQATGNGHLSRAIEITPYLQELADVDILLSGIQSDIRLNFPIRFRKYGLSFIFGKQGNIDLLRTAKSLKPMRLIYDIMTIDLDDYDLIINDFEPITAWACKIRGRKCVSLSHQASFRSDLTPRPKQKSLWAEKILQLYAPSTEYIGLHFKSYDENIRTPIIRSEIRNLNVSDKGHVTVYLPAYSKDFLISTFQKVKEVNFKVFVKGEKQKSVHGNVEVFPVGSEDWLEAFSSAHGAIMGAGFEGPSEALHLGKKLMVLPMTDQYEQVCNAVALEEMGVHVTRKIKSTFSSQIKYWLKQDEMERYDFPFHSNTLVENILKMA